MNVAQHTDRLLEGNKLEVIGKSWRNGKAGAERGIAADIDFYLWTRVLVILLLYEV